MKDYLTIISEIIRIERACLRRAWYLFCLWLEWRQNLYFAAFEQLEKSGETEGG